eukprot:GHVL01028446.1.p1 GENE.GHVL01028446.1~~GHVL01028446.1.p1  ORF type:complete len:121 (+),score=7.25 GHVL01028446.1:176-538(+)
MCCEECEHLSDFRTCLNECEKNVPDGCLNAESCAEFGQDAAKVIDRLACDEAFKTCGGGIESFSLVVDKSTCYQIASGSCIAHIREKHDVRDCKNYESENHLCWNKEYVMAVRFYCGRTN